MKFFKKLEVVEEYFTMIMFLGAIIISLYGVFMRYVMHMPKYGLAELTEFGMTYAIFLGFGRALKENHHIVVDIVYDKLPRPVKRVIAVFSNLLGAGFTLYLAIGGSNLVAVAKSNGYTTDADHIPIWITYLILPIAMYLMTAYFLMKALRAFINDNAEIEGVNSEAQSYIEEAERLQNEVNT